MEAIDPKRPVAAVKLQRPISERNGPCLPSRTCPRTQEHSVVL